jgi:hypothetical protein
MSHPERSILSASEHSITGTSLVAVPESDRVRIDAEEREDGWKRFSVLSRVSMGRSAICSIMATPLHYSGDNWQDVRDGLHDISYPARRVNRAARNSEKRAHLLAVGPASRELANILTNNQSYRTQTANAPVFTAFESLQYANDEIIRRMDTRKLLLQLKSVGINPVTARQLTEFVYYSNQSEAVVKELQAIAGLSEDDVNSSVNSAVLDRVDARAWAELAHRMQDTMFMGFVREVAFNQKLEYGGSDPAVFVLRDDVPDNIAHSERDASVEVGRKLRDLDRKTGRERFEIGFLTKEPKIVAHPRLVWERKGNERRFVYPLSTYNADDSERRGDGPVGRPSSILGAGLAANLGRFKYGIPYSATLSNRFYPRKSFGWPGNIAHGAGLLPLVVNHHEATLLGDDYFLAIERAIE